MGSWRGWGGRLPSWCCRSMSGRRWRVGCGAGRRRSPGRCDAGGHARCGIASTHAHRADEDVGDRPAEGTARTVAMTTNREWSSIPVTILHSRPSARKIPPTRSICHRCIGVSRCRRLYFRRCCSPGPPPASQPFPPGVEDNDTLRRRRPSPAARLGRVGCRAVGRWR
jgi:hypothetical protein